VVSEGFGEFNSMESKYRYRWLWPKELPDDFDRNNAVTRKVKDGKVTQYRVDNDDIYTQVNTLIKMAKKRALVDAALSAGRLSNVFTQDIEDIQDAVRAETEPEQKGNNGGAAQAEAGVTEPVDLTTLEFKNPGEFYTACLKHFTLAKSRVDAEVPDYDLTKSEQRQKAWQQLLAIYGHKAES
jgi:hypothetical protein